MKAKERREKMYLNQAEIGKLVGLSTFVVMFHRRNGYIPKPSHKIGKKYYYTPEQVKEVVEYFDNRERYERGAKQDDSWKDEVRKNLKTI